MAQTSLIRSISNDYSVQRCHVVSMAYLSFAIGSKRLNVKQPSSIKLVTYG